MIQIKHRYTGAILYEADKPTLREIVIEAVANGASLDGASLDGASLVGASLVGARLVGARLDGASLVGARLVGARLVGARLDGARLNWQSHDLLAELLRRAIPARDSIRDLTPPDLRRYALVGLILANRQWCWEDFLRAPVTKATRCWALRTLAAYRVEGDNAPPLIVRVRKRLDARAKATAQVADSGQVHRQNGAAPVDPPAPG